MEEGEEEAIVRSVFVSFANRYPNKAYVARMAQRMRAGTLTERTLRAFFAANPPRDALLEQARSMGAVQQDDQRLCFDPHSRRNIAPVQTPSRGQMPERIRRKFFSQ